MEANGSNPHRSLLGGEPIVATIHSVTVLARPSTGYNCDTRNLPATDSILQKSFISETHIQL